MNSLAHLLGSVLHIDTNLGALALLFAAGALVAREGSLSIWWAFSILVGAAILGDTVNYWIGHTIGPLLLKNENSRISKKEHADGTRVFFERYGAKTVVIGRFVPFVRTFAPLLAGVGEMHYPRFAVYNTAGATAWVGLFLLGGYLLGGIPFVRNNLILVLVAVVVITGVPVVAEYVRRRRASRRVSAKAEADQPWEPGDPCGASGRLGEE